MKKPDLNLREFTQRLSDDNLKFLATRLSQRYFGDVAESIEFLQTNNLIDRWLASADTSDELFDMIDFLEKAVTKESERRFATV